MQVKEAVIRLKTKQTYQRDYKRESFRSGPINIVKKTKA